MKNIVDGLSGAMLWMEIQEGKARMSAKKFQSLGSTSACVLRGVQATSEYKSFPIEDQTEGQFDLGLEKKWVTQNGYFRLYTTLLGMTVTDTWKYIKKQNEG